MENTGCDPILPLFTLARFGRTSSHCSRWESVRGARNVATHFDEHARQTAASHNAHRYAQNLRPDLLHASNDEAAPLNPQQQRATPQHRGSRHKALYGIAGFLIGVVFWHMVGFWSFVTEVVLAPPSGRAYSYAAVKMPVQIANNTNNIETGSIKKVAVSGKTSKAQSTVTGDITQPTEQPAIKNCSALQLDRKSGIIRTTPCPTAGPQPRNGKGVGRQDLALLRAAASAPERKHHKTDLQQLAADGLSLTNEPQQ